MSPEDAIAEALENPSVMSWAPKRIAGRIIDALTTNGWALTRIPEPEHRLTAENCLEARGKGYPISSGNVCHVCAQTASTEP